MGSIRTVENIAKLVKTSVTTLSLPASRINIGAQQYVTTSSKTLDTSIVGPGGLDSSISSSSVYYVYAVFYNSNVYLIGSVSGVSPSGFSQSRKVGAFTTGATSQILEAFYYGQVLTPGEWQNYSPTITGMGTITNDSTKYRRVGPSMEIISRITTGTPTGDVVYFSLPLGFTNSLSTSSQLLGWAIRNTTGNPATKKFNIASNVSLPTTVFFGRNELTQTASPYQPAIGTDMVSSGEAFSIQLSIPIAEWAGSGTQFIW